MILINLFIMTKILLKKLEKEEKFGSWATRLLHKSRKNRIKELKSKGLL